MENQWNEQNPAAVRPQQNPLANYQFSSDELRVLRECNSESFFQRSLPIGTTFGVAAYLGVQNGYLKPSIKYGAIPKVVFGVIVGYILGKLSYRQRCMEKMMQLPNSRVGEILRQQRDGGLMGRWKQEQNFGVGLSLSPFNSNVTDVYSDEDLKQQPQSNALNLDVERPVNAGLDDIYRPSLDSPSPSFEQEIPLEPAKTLTSYEELRKRNREEYEKSQNAFNRPLTPDTSVATRTRSPNYDNGNQQPTNRREKTNKYGDPLID